MKVVNLIGMRLEHIKHKDRQLFFDPESQVMYYGRSEDDLISPEGWEILGYLPPITLADVMNAFKLGLAIGKGEYKEIQEGF